MTPIPSERIDRRIYMLCGHVRDLSDAIDELSRDRDDAGEHEDAISRKAISGDAEIWTERFASRLRDPGEPISRSKAGFERFRAIDANSRATCATPATSFFSPLVLCRAVTALARATPSFAPGAAPALRGAYVDRRRRASVVNRVQPLCSISAAWMSSKRPVFVQCLSSGQ